jgi:hypothetical protein
MATTRTACCRPSASPGRTRVCLRQQLRRDHRPGTGRPPPRAGPRPGRPRTTPVRTASDRDHWRTVIQNVENTFLEEGPGPRVRSSAPRWRCAAASSRTVASRRRAMPPMGSNAFRKAGTHRGGARPGDDGDDGAPAEEHGVLHRPRGAAVRQVRPRFRGPPGVLGAGRGGRGRRDGRRAAAWPRPPSPPIVAGTYPIPRSVRPRMPEAPSEHPGAGGAVTRVRTLRSEADRREVDVALDRDRRVDVHGVGREVNA